MNGATNSMEELTVQKPEHDLGTAEGILAAARAAAPLLRERAAAIEANRHLPPDVVELLRSTGVFRMNMPKAWGGPELPSPRQVEVIEALAVGDPSAAWCAMIGSDSGIYSGFLAEEVARELFPRLDMVTAGWIHPEGVAERVAGGYRVSGRWRFGSGCTHSDWLVAGCRVYRDGEPEPDPGGGPVHWRIMLARPEDYEITDTWHTTGLAGSGSRDYAVTDLFVPEERSFSLAEPHRPGPLHALPDTILRKMSGVPLGVSRAALDYVRKLAETRVDRSTGLPWAGEYRVRAGIAAAEAELAAARAGVYTSLEQQWQRLTAGTGSSLDDRAAVALARHTAFRTARSILNRLYDLVGGSSIYRDAGPLDRWLRDVTTMNQHAVAQDGILQAAGELLLTGKTESLFL
jgi:alkylation response protein AidB-like acyl-CoA dehydrogenase